MINDKFDEVEWRPNMMCVYEGQVRHISGVNFDLKTISLWHLNKLTTHWVSWEKIELLVN